jgi:hypothetical protein
MRQGSFADGSTLWLNSAEWVTAPLSLTIPETEQPDRYWMWDYKLRQSSREKRFEAYAIEVDRLTQGLMFLETQWHRSHDSQHSSLVYIEAIAAAP